jgi:serine/threonine-protein kinase
MSVPATSVDLPLPRSLGRYTLFDKIGQGGMADIFLARAQTELGATRLVVVKQILPRLAESPEFSDLLITEAKLAARLDHANVVQVHDLGKVDGVLYIAMQYVEGFDLIELLRRCSRTKTALPVQYSLLIVIEALRGLDYAHRRTSEDGRPLGIVHRDVSPSNILISLEGEVKLCDFGIAHANDAAPHPEDVIKGKAGYMSPEQARGESIDARADVFSVGIVLWELLAGRRLYRVAAEGGPSLLEQAKAARIPDLASRGLPLEETLFAIVNKALAPNRDERYQSARELLRDLEDYVAESKLIASPIRFGEWLINRFGEELVQARRAHERAAQDLEAGQPAQGAPEAAPLSPTSGRWAVGAEATQDEKPAPAYQMPIVPPSDRRGETSIIAPVAAPRVSPVGKMLWVSVAIVGVIYLLLSYR